MMGVCTGESGAWNELVFSGWVFCLMVKAWLVHKGPHPNDFESQYILGS